MKRFLTIILTLITISANAKVQYAEHSVLKEGEWIKISVKETGIHKTCPNDETPSTTPYAGNLSKYQPKIPLYACDAQEFYNPESDSTDPKIHNTP